MMVQMTILKIWICDKYLLTLRISVLMDFQKAWWIPMKYGRSTWVKIIPES